MLRRVAVTALAYGLLSLGSSLSAQDLAQRTAEATAYINAHADKEDMVMAPMRDGVRLYHLILFPKEQPRQGLPAVLIRSPYLINPDHVGFELYVRSFLEHGYAVVFQSERGRYFSEGTYTYLVGSANDGFDTVEWLAKQPWSNGKVGALGCSSSAEEQHKLNGAHAPHFAASVPMGSGAGIGRVGPYNEMGNFYRGGAMQMLWFGWYYGAGYTFRPVFPANLTREQMVRLHRFWNLDPEIQPSSAAVDSAMWALPINQIPNRLHAPPSDLDQFVNRLPNDPAWKTVDFGGEGDAASAPILMINSWYDISVAPNIAMYEYQAAHAATDIARNNTFMVIAPTTHCAEGSVESEHTIVGERDMGDARFDYVGLIQRWYDHWLKGIDNGVTSEPKVRAYMMGANQWRSYDRWPPREAGTVAYYLESDGRANSVLGEGRLSTTRPTKSAADSFIYDPMRPVPCRGGAICSPLAGSVDQSSVEMRSDVLVYSTPPLTRRVAIAGPVSVSLYLSSDRKDTDLTVKLVDVYPDGRAFNLDETIQRVRWREGWDHPVLMEPNRVYKVDLGPLETSNEFAVGHRIRIEIASSNFPRFERNLNTGGNNYDEAVGLVAHNVIHHGPTYPSMISLPVLSTDGQLEAQSPRQNQ